MKTLSTYLIVKNEEQVIERCINSILSFSDEIIIVDTGSIDKTKDIIKSINNKKIKIYDFEWCDDFSKARNFSLSKTASDYVLTTDADEVFEKSLQEEILYFKENDFFNFTQIFVPLTNFDENENEIDTICYDSRSIIKKSSNPIWVNPVHEHIHISNGQITSTYLKSGRILHKKHGGAKSQYPKYKEIFLRSITENFDIKNVDCDYFNYFYFTLLWDDIPLCKKILSKVFSYQHIKNSSDYRIYNFSIGRMTDFEFFIMSMINDPYITNDELKIKLLFDIITKLKHEDTSEYLALEFFKKNRENNIFKPYLPEAYKKLAKKELEYNFPKDFIETSELLYEIDKSTYDNFMKASELKSFMNNTNIIINSKLYKSSLIYYANRYFNNIFVIADKNEKYIPSFCKKEESIEKILETEKNFDKTLILNSEQQIFSIQFRNLYDDFKNSKEKIYKITL